MGLVLPYIRIFAGIAIMALLSGYAPQFFSLMSTSGEGDLLITFFVIALLGLVGFVVHYLSERTIFPSFVVAIFFGIAAHPLFLPVLEGPHTMGILVGFGATLILFSGGLEIPFRHFRCFVGHIFSLSFIGFVLTAFLFSYMVQWVSMLFGMPLPTMVSVLLGAVLASTDPAAIIPVLSRLRFRQRAAKDIVISESAITDVIGTLFTVVFLTLILDGGTLPATVWEAYQSLFQQEIGLLFLKQMVVGLVFGALGYGLLELLIRFKRNHAVESGVDAAFFMGVPVLVFVGALAFGGSGYLAAFIAGLLLMLTEQLYETERFFEHMIDGFLKPMIFVLLGALVDIGSLWTFAPIGITVALLFMVVVRPLAVVVSLFPFVFWGKKRLSWRDLAFIAFIRETGAIPAVLLVTIISLGVPGLTGLVPVGMWVILLTLTIEPALTPRVAMALGVATPIADTKGITLADGGNHPIVVVASRGYSYARRLPFILDWASKHHVYHVVLLCCPEGRYTEELASYVEHHAMGIVAEKNSELKAAGRKAIEFAPVIRTGFLQENIEELLSKHGEQVSALFVGKRVLDYGLPQIKALNVPLYFVD